MYGWRARLGVLIPSATTVTEPEFTHMVPEGVTCHFQRFTFNALGGIEVLKNLRNSMIEPVEDLLHIRPAAIALCGTAASFAGGKGYDRPIIEELQEKTGLPATTTSTAMLEAFRRLGITKVSVATPYLEEIAKAGERFLEENGIAVVNLNWLNKGGFEFSRIPYEVTYGMGKEVDSPEAEAVFISCVALPTAGLIEKLERDLGKPVITSNQATLWHLLRLAGINEKIEGFGTLFRV